MNKYMELIQNEREWYKSILNVIKREMDGSVSEQQTYLCGQKFIVTDTIVRLNHILTDMRDIPMNVTVKRYCNECYKDTDHEDDWSTGMLKLACLICKKEESGIDKKLRTGIQDDIVDKKLGYSEYDDTLPELDPLLGASAHLDTAKDCMSEFSDINGAIKHLGHAIDCLIEAVAEASIK